MLDCRNAPVEVGDYITYGTNKGQRVGPVVKIRTVLEVYGSSHRDPDDVVSITIENAGTETFKNGVQTISYPESRKLLNVSAIVRGLDRDFSLD